MRDTFAFTSERKLYNRLRPTFDDAERTHALDRLIACSISFAYREGPWDFPSQQEVDQDTDRVDDSSQ